MNTEELTSDNGAIAELYKLAKATRDFEIEQLVQRNNFFMIFQGVLMAGLLQAAGNGKIIPIVAFLVSIAGFGAACLQVCMAAGAKFWQERWEYAVEEAERILISEIGNFPNREAIYEVFTAGMLHVQQVVERRVGGGLTAYLINRRFSPSRIPIYTGLLFGAIWALLILAQMNGSFGFRAV